MIDGWWPITIPEPEEAEENSGIDTDRSEEITFTQPPVAFSSTSDKMSVTLHQLTTLTVLFENQQNDIHHTKQRQNRRWTGDLISSLRNAVGNAESGDKQGKIDSVTRKKKKKKKI